MDVFYMRKYDSPFPERFDLEPTVALEEPWGEDVATPSQEFVRVDIGRSTPLPSPGSNRTETDFWGPDPSPLNISAACTSAHRVAVTTGVASAN